MECEKAKMVMEIDKSEVDNYKATNYKGKRTFIQVQMCMWMDVNIHT